MRIDASSLVILSLLIMIVQKYLVVLIIIMIIMITATLAVAANRDYTYLVVTNKIICMNIMDTDIIVVS